MWAQNSKRFVNIRNIFEFQETIQVISECMAISLVEIKGLAEHPDEGQIATIVIQVSQSWR